MADATNSDIPSLILHEARELRRKQDDQIRRILSTSTVTIATFLSVGTITAAAAGNRSEVAPFAILGAALILTLIPARIQRETRDWQEGPDVLRMLDNFNRGSATTAEFQVGLALTFTGQRRINEVILVRARRLLGLQVAVAVLGTITLASTLLWAGGGGTG